MFFAAEQLGNLLDIGIFGWGGLLTLVMVLVIWFVGRRSLKGENIVLGVMLLGGIALIVYGYFKSH